MDAILGGRLDALMHDLPELPELDNLFAPEVGRTAVVFNPLLQTLGASRKPVAVTPPHE